MHDIRPGVPGDAVALTDIAHAAKRYWGYPEDWMRAWRGDLTVTDQYLRQHAVYVAEEDGTPAGFIALDLSADAPEVDHLWVRPAAMGRGIGRSLMARALVHCRNEGVARLRILSDPHAEGFYRRMGARYAGELPSTPPPRTLPLLWIDLNQDIGR